MATLGLCFHAEPGHWAWHIGPFEHVRLEVVRREAMTRVDAILWEARSQIAQVDARELKVDLWDRAYHRMLEAVVELDVECSRIRREEGLPTQGVEWGPAQAPVTVADFQRSMTAPAPMTAKKKPASKQAVKKKPASTMPAKKPASKQAVKKKPASTMPAKNSVIDQQ